MNTVINLFRNLWNALGCVVELLGYLPRFVSVFFRTRASLAARVLAAESQLSMCQRRIDQKLQPKAQVHRWFSTFMGLLVEAVDAMADSHPVDAAGHRQGLAHSRVQALLAVEVETESRASSYHPGNAGPDPEAQPREPAVGPGGDSPHVAEPAL